MLQLNKLFKKTNERTVVLGVYRMAGSFIVGTSVRLVGGGILMRCNVRMEECGGMRFKMMSFVFRDIVAEDARSEVTYAAGTRGLRPMPIPTRTNVSKHARPLINRSSSHSTAPFSNSTTIVDPPNAKYPNSWPRFTSWPSSTVILMLPTIIAPIHTAMTRPNCGLWMGTILRAFSP